MAIKNITAVLSRFNSNLWHFHLVIPANAVKSLTKNNQRRVICTLNQTVTFQAALMPLGDGNFFVNVNQTIRKKLRLNEGDEVHITLEKDNSEYGLPMPAEFQELMDQDTEGAKVFHSLTPGKQRTLLYIIGKPKSVDLRIRNSIAILEHLKRNNGEIHYKTLNQEMKGA